MEYQEFIKRTNNAIVNKSKDEILLNNKNRFLRANLILQLLKNTSQYLKFFDFQNNIIFEKNDPFILINGLKFKLDTFFFLKKSGTPHISEVKNTISFIESYNLNPKVIIDLGACWGEYSLFLAKEFKKSKIFKLLIEIFSGKFLTLDPVLAKFTKADKSAESDSKFNVPTLYIPLFCKKQDLVLALTMSLICAN